MSPNTKYCKRCNLEKPVDQFNRWSRGKDGLQVWCRACQAADEKTPASRARGARYYKANRDKLDAQNKQWALDHPDARKAIWLRYQQNNRELTRKASLASWRKNYEHYRIGAVANDRKRRARKKGAPINDLTPAQWKYRLEEFNYHCAYCLAPLVPEHTTQDHMKPLSRGGSHTLDNIVPACRSCNSSKRDKTLLEFFGWMNGRPIRQAKPGEVYAV